MPTTIKYTGYRVNEHIGSCQSVNILKRHLLWSHEANSYQISYIASIGRGIVFLFQWDENSGCYDNL